MKGCIYMRKNELRFYHFAKIDNPQKKGFYSTINVYTCVCGLGDADMLCSILIIGASSVVYSIYVYTRCSALNMYHNHDVNIIEVPP